MLDPLAPDVDAARLSACLAVCASRGAATIRPDRTRVRRNALHRVAGSMMARPRTDELDGSRLGEVTRLEAAANRRAVSVLENNRFGIRIIDTHDVPYRRGIHRTGF